MPPSSATRYSCAQRQFPAWQQWLDHPLVDTDWTAALLDDLPTEVRFYFVHSYYVTCLQSEDVLVATTYGHEFHSGFHRGNVWGVQFHPEKSHKFGMHLLRNFAERC